MGKLLTESQQVIQAQSSVALNLHVTGPRSWSNTGETYCTGSAYRGNRYFDNLSLTQLFSSVTSAAHFAATLNELNGFFAVIHRGNNNEIYAATDRSRSIPLFYCADQRQFCLSSDSSWISRQVGAGDPAPDIAAEFALTGYVTGRDTLHPRIKQMQSGEMLYFNPAFDQHPRVDYYYRYRRTPDFSLDPRQLLERMHQALRIVCQRLIDVADGRLIVVPLSGGLDSTRICMMLRQLNYQRVLAYTYGRPGNVEARHSRTIAQQLGYAWHFEPYTEQLWPRWFDSAQCKEYCRFAGALNTVPVLQEWAAIGQMQQAKVLPDDALFVPGYSSEAFLGATYMPDDWPPYDEHGLHTDDIARATLEMHYAQPVPLPRTPELNAQMLTRIIRAFGRIEDHPSSASMYENWAFNERQAKFTTNAVRAFEYWGYDWWLPLWDTTWTKYWGTPPMRLRRGRKLSLGYTSAAYPQITGHEYPVPTGSKKPTWRSYLIHGAQRAAQYSVICRELYRRLDCEAKYRHPLAWYGIIPRPLFRRLFQPGASINSFLAQYQLGLIDLHC